MSVSLLWWWQRDYITISMSDCCWVPGQMLKSWLQISSRRRFQDDFRACTGQNPSGLDGTTASGSRSGYQSFLRVLAKQLTHKGSYILIGLFIATATSSFSEEVFFLGAAKDRSCLVIIIHQLGAEWQPNLYFSGQTWGGWHRGAPAAEPPDGIFYQLNKNNIIFIQQINVCSSVRNASAGVQGRNNLHVFTGATVCWLANVLPEVFADVCLSKHGILRLFWVSSIVCTCRKNTRQVLHCSRMFHIPHSTRPKHFHKTFPSRRVSPM